MNFDFMASLPLVAPALMLLALILLTTVQGYNVLFVASALVGGSAGAVLPVWPGFVAFRFGPRALPQVMGLMSPLVLSLQGFGAHSADAEYVLIDSIEPRL